MTKPAIASRLIVKNIPKHVDEKRLRQHFSVKAELTDAKIVRTKDGKSRQFAFVGFATDEDAREAIKYYNSTFLDTSRIQVEPAQPRGDPSIGRPWSRHSEGSSRMQRKQQLRPSSKAEKSKADRDAADSKGSRDDRDHNGDADDVKKSKKASASASDSGGAPGRADRTRPAGQEVGREEFFAAMKARSQARFWDNDDALLSTSRAGALEEGHVPDGASGSSEEEDTFTAQGDGGDGGGRSRNKKSVSAAPSSDMDWLRSRVMNDDDEKGDNEAGVEADGDGDEDEDDEESENDADADGGDSQSALRVKDGKGAKGKQSRDVDAESDTGAGSGAGDDASNDGNDDDDDDDESKPSSGRLFVRNLPYVCTEEDLQELFEQFGLLSEVHLPLDDFNKVKGFAFVQYALPEDAAEAIRYLDKHAFRGRLLHVIPARKQLGSSVPGNSSSEAGSASASGNTFKQQKENARRAKAGDSTGWNASFMRADTVVDALADRLGVSKGDILDREGNDMAVRLALGESQLVKENKQYFEQEGINLNALESSKAKGGNKVAEERSKTVILVKNLPYTTDVTELAKRFGAFGDVGRVLLPPSKAVALVEFLVPADARRAFKRLAYTKFQHVPLYLEWAPLKAFRDSFRPSSEPATLSALAACEGRSATADEAKVDGDEVEAGQASQEPCTIFVKNLSFSTNEEGLKACFDRAGLAVRSVSIPRKKGKGKSEGMLSSGIGFVECVDSGMADKALKALQGTILDGHALEVKRSTKRLVKGPAKSSQQAAGEKRSKLIIRNIPFQATAKELRELFSTFGQLKRLRLPKKFDGGHRGFAFVDFLTSQEAQNAKTSLESTHFYGRHLVGEWAEDDEAVETLRAKAARDMRGVEESAKRAKRKRAGDGDPFDVEQP